MLGIRFAINYGQRLVEKMLVHERVKGKKALLLLFNFLKAGLIKTENILRDDDKENAKQMEELVKSEVPALLRALADEIEKSFTKKEVGDGTTI